MLSVPEQWYQPMVLPIIATFFGVLVFMLGLMKERSVAGQKAMWKWAGVGICLFGAYASWQFFAPFVGIGGDAVLNRMYQEAAIGRKMAIGHWLSFLIPFLAALGCAGINAFHLKLRKEYED